MQSLITCWFVCLKKNKLQTASEIFYNLDIKKGIMLSQIPKLFF